MSSSALLAATPCYFSARVALRQGLDATHYEGTTRFNLRSFWAEYKHVLPIHYHVYLAEVACKKAAAANVETVFSGTGKFMAEARRTRSLHLLRRGPYLTPHPWCSVHLCSRLSRAPPFSPAS